MKNLAKKKEHIFFLCMRGFLCALHIINASSNTIIYLLVYSYWINLKWYLLLLCLARDMICKRRADEIAYNYKQS